MCSFCVFERTLLRWGVTPIIPSPFTQVHFTSLAMKSANVPAAPRQWLPVVAGLASIPMIIHPIDDFVESMMNRTVRKLSKFEPRTPHKFSSA